MEPVALAADPVALLGEVPEGAGGLMALPFTPFKLGRIPLPPAPVTFGLTAGIGPGDFVSKNPVAVKLKYGISASATATFWYFVTLATNPNTLE